MVRVTKSVSPLLACMIGASGCLIFSGCATRFKSQAQVRNMGGSEAPRLLGQDFRLPPLYELDLKKSVHTFTETGMVGLKDASIALADYAQIRADFENLQRLSDVEIDQWLLQNAVRISSAQINSTTNDPIPADGTQSSALRPVSCGRASVFRLSEGTDTERGARLIESKGTGTFQPKKGSHSNGLSTFAEALREYHYEKLVRTILDHQDVPTTTVPVYAVVRLGFNVLFEQNGSQPAGLVVRAAATRTSALANEAGIPRYENAVAREKALAVENALRRFGFTSLLEGTNRDKGDFINVQLTSSGHVLDFGGYRRRTQFNRPVLFPRACDPSDAHKQGKIFDPVSFGCVETDRIIFALSPAHPQFVKEADPALVVESKDWESNPTVNHDIGDHVDGLGVLSGEVSAAFAVSKDKAQQRALEIHCALLVPVLKKIRRDPGLLSSTQKCP